MAQEIITYLVVSVAVVLAFGKLSGKLRRKTRKQSSCSDNELRENSGCGSCSADCSLRDSFSGSYKK